MDSIRVEFLDETSRAIRKANACLNDMISSCDNEKELNQLVRGINEYLNQKHEGFNEKSPYLIKKEQMSFMSDNKKTMAIKKMITRAFIYSALKQGN